MPEYVPGIGNSCAKLVVVGEAPGAEEERTKIPFSGPTGRLVDDLLEGAGMPRVEVYTTNVVKIRPPQNNIKRLGEYGKTIEDYIPQLWAEIDAIQPNCVLAFGNTALEALTGYRGIEKYRGSILQSKHGYPKVVSSLHPASLMHKESDGKMRSWSDLTFIRWDVERAVKQSRFKELDSPKRYLRIAKSFMDVDRFLRANQHRRYVSVDIETFRTIPICIGLAFDNYEALSIPLFSIIDKNQRAYVWEALAKLLANPFIYKIGQNFKFDQGKLECCVNRTEFFGFRTLSVFFDTLLAFRILYPELPASLEFIASVMTEEPYWKGEGKSYNPKKDSLEKLLLYNAKDAVVTYEIFEKELFELRENGLEDFFFTKIMPLHYLYRGIEDIGILKDQTAAKILEEKYVTLREARESELQALIDSFGLDAQVVGTKETKGKRVRLYNAPMQVAKLLYIGMSVPERVDVSDETLSGLIRNTVKNSKVKRTIELILELRKIGKTIGTYINAKTFSDGRFRTSYRLALETGRTSTSIIRPPDTTTPMGIAFQTITKHGDVGQDLRSLFIADPGKCLIEADQSQAEARVVALLANDKRLLDLFEFRIDLHRVTFGWISDRCPNELLNEFFNSPTKERAKEINDFLKGVMDDEERQLGKKFRHAANYNMQKREASRQAHVSEWRAGQILDKIHKTNSNIQGVFHEEIRQALAKENRTLINPFGRRRQFLGKWGNDLFKEAFAQIPQSTISDHTKFTMGRVQLRMPELEIIEESHDSFLAQLPNNDACLQKAYRIIKEEFQQPIDFKNCTLSRGIIVIPTDIKIGHNWERMETYNG